MLSIYQKICYKLLGHVCKKYAYKNYRLKEKLDMANVELLPDAFLACTLFTCIVTMVVGLVIAMVLNILLPKIISLPEMFYTLLFIILPLLFGVILYCIIIVSIDSKIKKRKKDIDLHLAYATNFITMMAAAHATPQKIFKSLGKQVDIYSEVSKESARIYRDMEVHGCDLITALKRAVVRSPSDKFKEFLQGIVGTLTAGGNFRNYLSAKAEHYMRENRREQKDTIESISILAESYVVVGVAMPLFLIIILVIMSWIGTMKELALSLLFLIIFIMLPVIHVAYISVFSGTSGKV